MKVEQNIWIANEGWKNEPENSKLNKAQIVLIFGGNGLMDRSGALEIMRKLYPVAEIVGCSSSGEIFEDTEFDNSFTYTAIYFEKSYVKTASVHFETRGESYESGKRLAQSLPPNELKHVFVLSDGLKINGDELVRGIADGLPPEVAFTGGLSSDNGSYKQTYVVKDGVPKTQQILAIGFYGDDLEIGYGSGGGWNPFGPYRLTTRTNGNIIYELDGKPALELYKAYMGRFYENKTSSLLLPVCLKNDTGCEDEVIRHVVAVDENENSLMLTGDLPEGVYIRLMKSNTESIVNGAIKAAVRCLESSGSDEPELAILVSCSGRKMLLKLRVDEEIEGVRETFGNKTVFTGFYSYGEISPFKKGMKCDLHNQTMTITTFKEN